MWRGNFTADKSAINSASTRWNVCRMVARRSWCYRKWRGDVTLPLVFHGGSIHGTGVVEYQLAIYPLFSLSCSALRRADVVEIAFILVNSFLLRRTLCLFASKVFVIVYEMLEILLYARLSWMFNLKAGLCLEFIWIALGSPLGISSKRFCWWIFFFFLIWLIGWTIEYDEVEI